MVKMTHTTCVNGDERPIYPPSAVLCKECLASLDGKIQGLALRFGIEATATPTCKLCQGDGWYGLERYCDCPAGDALRAQDGRSTGARQ